MKILELCDQYFLILMLIEGFILNFIDFKNFKNKNQLSIARKAKFIGIGSVIIAIILFVLREMFI